MKKSEPPKIDRNYSLLDAIKQESLYKKTNGRDPKSRQIIESELKDIKSSKGDIMPGQLILFNYLSPKTLEELEYYDASPLTIYFGIYREGSKARAIGFNLHYYPPQFRFRILDKIFDMYRPIYTKYFDSGLSHDLDGFDYAYIIDVLNRYNLSFGVRMYDIKLMTNVVPIPPQLWSKAVFTEGHFKKETRAHIMNLWKQDSKKRGKISTIYRKKKKK